MCLYWGAVSRRQFTEHLSELAKKVSVNLGSITSRLRSNREFHYNDLSDFLLGRRIATKIAANPKMATRRLRRSKMVCQRISRKNSKLPPFVAGTCPGMRKKGKDRTYVSTESANGVWTWT
jgi:hypothetical protein